MEPPSPRQVVVLNESGRRVVTAPMRRGIGAVLRLHGHPAAAVSVLLTGDDAVRELNRRYRRIDEPTDVLSFPSSDVPGAPLGDVAISVQAAERQARARGISLSLELAYLGIHGALHLVGFDDEEEGARAIMIEQMSRAAEAAGLPPDPEWHSAHHAQEAASW